VDPLSVNCLSLSKSDGKDSKKKNDKSAVANPAISDGDAGSVTCKTCRMNHSATNCPRFQAMQQEDVVRRGELFPGKSDKDGKKRGAKTNHNIESSEEPGEMFCLLCSQLRYVPQWASRNHTAQECGQLAKFQKQVGEGSGVDYTSRIR
jgi:hypothetical protein